MVTILPWKDTELGLQVYLAYFSQIYPACHPLLVNSNPLSWLAKDRLM